MIKKAQQIIVCKLSEDSVKGGWKVNLAYRTEPVDYVVMHTWPTIEEVSRRAALGWRPGKGYNCL